MPGIPPLPENTLSFKCPSCLKVSTIKASQILHGFTCPGCGKKIEGTGGGSSSGQQSLFICPKCGSKEIEHAQYSSEGKLFRCKSCGAEW
jgi:predicted RNA-binding Zn-ribbon protein involved in translation (DUF1610 family)